MKTFGERLKECIDNSPLTQKQLAYASDVTQGSISSYIQGRYEPRASIAYRIAKALGVTVEYLVTGSENEHVDVTKLEFIAEKLIHSVQESGGVYYSRDEKEILDMLRSNLELIPKVKKYLSYYVEHAKNTQSWLLAVIDDLTKKDLLEMIVLLSQRLQKVCYD